MKILGIDQGLANCGFSIINIDEEDFEILKIGTVKTKSGEILQNRLNYIYKELDNLIKCNKDIQLIGIEKLNGKVMTVQLITSIVYLLSYKYQIPVIELVPSSVKKEITGNGRASKKDIQESLKENHMKDYKKRTNNHERDSISIGITCYKKIQDKKSNYYKKYEEQNYKMKKGG